MSASIVGSVLDRYHGKANLKITLLALADAANSQTGECNPSYDLIAGQTNVHRVTAIRNVAALMDEGIIQIVDHGGFRTDPETKRRVFVTNVFRINLDMLSVMPTWKQLAKDRPSGRSPRKAHGNKDATVSDGLHGSVHATVGGNQHGNTRDTQQLCGQLPSHGSTDATVSMTQVQPCKGSTGATLTKTLEPNPEGQGLSTSTSLLPVALNRAAIVAQRREIRTQARDGLVAYHGRKQVAR